MKYLEPIDYNTSKFVEFYDELPLWSARFGLMLLDRIAIRSGITIADIGSGTGFLSIKLAQLCGAETKIIAIDPWEDAMKRLSRKLEFLELKNVQVMVQDAANTGLPNASVDLIVSNLGINNFDNRDAVLQECYRIAKPGAQLLLTTNLVGHMQEFYDAYREVLIELGYTDRLPVLEEHINHRATVDSVKAQLENAGFQFVDAQTGSFVETYSNGSALFESFFIRMAFMPAWKAIAPPTAVTKVFRALEHHLSWGRRMYPPTLSLTIPTACIEARKI